MDISPSFVTTPATAGPDPLRRARLAWLLTEAANEPFFALIQRFVFASYFANVLMGGSQRGAALWGYGLAAAGLLTGVLAPLCGAYADATGLRKPLVRVLALVSAAACASLWFAAPGVSPLPVLAAFVIAAVGLELIVALTNADLSDLAPEHKVGRLSALNFAVGQAAAVVALLVVAGLPAIEELGGVSFVERIVGPLAAVAMLVLLAPYMLTGSSRARPEGVRGAGFGVSTALLWSAIRRAWRDRNMRFLLIARGIGADGMSIVFAFGAILGGSVLGWRGVQIAIFGLLVTTVAALGGLLAGWLDRRLGSRGVVLAAFGLCAIGALGIIGAGPERVLFLTVDSADVVLGLSPPEIGYGLSACIAALSAGPCFGGMRTLVAKIAPRDQMGVYFGLYSVVGKATYFLGPLTFGLVLSFVGDRQAALSVAYVFMLVGVVSVLALREIRMSSE